MSARAIASKPIYYDRDLYQSANAFLKKHQHEKNGLSVKGYGCSLAKFHMRVIEQNQVDTIDKVGLFFQKIGCCFWSTIKYLNPLGGFFYAKEDFDLLKSNKWRWVIPCINFLSGTGAIYWIGYAIFKCASSSEDETSKATITNSACQPPEDEASYSQIQSKEMFDEEGDSPFFDEG